MPDAAQFDDEGADTLGHTLAAVPDLQVPNLAALGLGCLVSGLRLPRPIRGGWGKAAIANPAKDTVAGHWELAGYIQDPPFRTYPNGFPAEVIEAFCSRAGVAGVLGNCAASGTEIIERLGPEHLRSGLPIVYTSADSVFQIAAHEEVIPLPRLYEMCRAARAVLVPPHLVARVIARPFVGQPGSFRRTENRRDFALEPGGATLLDRASARGLPVIAIGKIEDIFAGRGITEADHTTNNAAGVEATIRYLRKGPEGGLLFTNLVDFDMLYGHRRNPQAFARALAEFDAALPRITEALRPADLLVITADHGCDPTLARHTDHTREYVPLLCLGAGITPGRSLGVRATLADVGATAGEWLGVGPLPVGTSWLI